MKKLTPEEVQSLAITKETRIVQIPLSESETSLAKDNLVQNSIKLSNQQEELARVSEAIKIEIKKTKFDIKANLNDLRNGYVESEFESVGLLELQEKEAKEIFGKEIKRFKDILIMYKN